ncbi:MAG: S8 family serine peptidase [Clostridiales bacterium]|nr:S8 family serine peptidase [Clostridiales bacterium]
MKKIALIDDGLSYNRFNTNNVYKEYIIRNKTINEYNSQKAEFDSHGRVCASIIESLTKTSNIISINVKDENENGICDDFIVALNLCRELDVDIVNTSIGSCYKEDFHIIRKAIKPLLLKKITIVSATSNKPLITYPAFSNFVIGVRHNIRGIGGKLIYLDYSKYGVNIETSAPNFIIDSSNEKIALHPCNSFAAPVVTSIIYAIIEENGRISIKDLKQELKSRADFYKKYDSVKVDKLEAYFYE